MDPGTFVDPNLTRPDFLVLENLLQDGQIPSEDLSGVASQQSHGIQNRINKGKSLCTIYILALRPSPALSW